MQQSPCFLLSALELYHWRGLFYSLVSDLLTQIYNAFDPFRPLPAGDPAYVDCQEVRGDNDILVDLGNEIRRSNQMTCQLYAGHRGAGKSTELLRLKQDLEAQGCFVVYFAADAEDVDPEDAEYTDLLLACTRHLLEELKKADPKPLLSWLRERWRSLEDLALTEIAFDKLDVQTQLSQFAKLSTSIRAIPSLRHEIRRRVNPHTTTLIDALNQFIADGKKELPGGQTQLAVIADNLDRIVPILNEDGRTTNHEEIFLNRSGQLQALDCHLIYTVPISMVYSNRANDLKDIYGNPQVLPMIMVQTRDGNVHQPGFEKVKEVIARRINPIAPAQSLETTIFESPEALSRLCFMSGGHVRELMHLTKEAINRSRQLPITVRAVQRAITEARDTYRRTVQRGQWEILATVANSKRIENDESYRELLFRRCVLEYRYFDSEGELQCWYDVHPLIRGIQEFKEALAKVQHEARPD